ncbi:MAG: DUF485 domain-containing protein [Magnetococcales bacterium]|nr:DUF485 domain-containing protein [Magnetococcales bacterium]
MSDISVDPKMVEKILQNQKYKDLVTKRSKFAWTLSIIMLIIYYAFVLIVAFAPNLLGTKISPQSVISVGVPLGVFIIIAAFILTGIYVRRANGEFDTLTQQIKEEMK